jgi:hypothetical protein
MNIQLLQWGLFSFMIGLILSLPLAAVHYQRMKLWTKLFTNPRKLKSAHMDFFMQAFALGFVYVLEIVTKEKFPLYVVIPLVFGSICNPLILLFEATPLQRSRITKVLRAISPISLIFAWFVIAFSFLPMYLLLLLTAFVLTGLFVVIRYTSNVDASSERLNVTI